MPGILAIDQATTTGWAHCEPGQLPQWGHKRLGKPGADHEEIAQSFDLFLRSLIEHATPRHLIFERPFLGIQNAQTIMLLAGLRWHILLVAQQYGLRARDQETRAAVKLLTGQGKFPGVTPAERRKAKKDATMAACWARGWKATEDEADALALLLFAESRLYPREAKQRSMIFKEQTGPLFA
jgi:Holliday junction resolvasome RuvABC endonuclease subunit